MNASAQSPLPSSRLMSLDVFRGATIAAMMLVNNPGSWGNIFSPFEHAKWHGWTFTDLIFPFFLWIVGVAIPFSFGRRLEEGADRSKLLVHVIRRSVILFAIGLFLNGFPYFDLASIRIPGVLQRIAVCYLIASMIFLWTKLRGQIIWTAIFLTVYWLLMAFARVDGYQTGSLEKGHNFAQYIDQLALGKHVWASTKTWDPEGIVSTLPAIATCLFGIFAGHLLRAKLTPEEKTAWLFVIGNILLFAGSVMNFWLPINKSLWTSSYTVFMAGMAMNCFAVCYWLVDVKGHQTLAKPLAIYGMNAITIFVLAGILGRLSNEIKVGTASSVSLKNYLYETVLLSIASPKVASLIYAVLCVIGLYFVAWFMYRRKWFVRF